VSFTWKPSASVKDVNANRSYTIGLYDPSGKVFTFMFTGIVGYDENTGIGWVIDGNRITFTGVTTKIRIGIQENISVQNYHRE
jgi:hypothetical protein